MPAYDDNDPAWPPRLRGWLEGHTTTEEYVRKWIATCLPPKEWFKETLQFYAGAPDTQPVAYLFRLGDIRDLAEFIHGIEGVTSGSNPKVQD